MTATDLTRHQRFVRWSKTLPKKLGLLALAVVLTLFALEGVFRLLGYQPLYDVYSRPEAFWQHDRQLGWSLKPGARGEFVGPRPFPIEFRNHIRINSLGFRGPEITPVPPGGHRVLVLGDSYAAGFEVAENRRYSAIAQDQLTQALGSPVQVINTGVRGYGTDQEYLTYLGRGRALHPDVVVLHVDETDPNDNVSLHRMGKLFGKPAFRFGSDGALSLVGSPVRSYPTCSSYRLDEQFHVSRVDSTRERAFCWLETNLASRSALFSFAVTRIRTNRTLVKFFHNFGVPEDQQAAGPPAVTPQTELAVARATPEAKSAPDDTKPPPVAFPLPDYAHQLTSALIETLGAAVQQDGARLVVLGDAAALDGLDVAAFERQGISIVRPDEQLNRGNEQVRFRNDGHFTPLGHRRIAEALVPTLVYVLRG